MTADTMPAEVPDYYYPDELERFRTDTADHVMEILHDDGLYRHIRFQRPPESGSSWYCWYELITTPGQLTIRGDMGTYVFSRVTDMFEFFGGKAYINPGYWGEKLLAVSKNSGYREYSEDAARRIIREHSDDYVESLDDHFGALLWSAIEAEILDEDTIPFEDETRRKLNDFYDKGTGFAFSDVWEWDLHDFTVQYLWCCHAIRCGVEQYRAAKAGS